MRHLFGMLSAIVATLFLTGFTTSSIVGPMTVVEINGFQLSGAEYWPFVSNDPFRYPSDVLWGFYPESATAESITCAEKSWSALTAFFRDNEQLMQDVVARGATRKFYLWTNDYIAAANDRPIRTSRMWHWNSGPRDYKNGYWKWESTLTVNGDCVLPKPAQIQEELYEALRVLSRNQVHQF